MIPLNSERTQTNHALDCAKLDTQDHLLVCKNQLNIITKKYQPKYQDLFLENSQEQSDVAITGTELHGGDTAHTFLMGEHRKNI